MADLHKNFVNTHVAIVPSPATSGTSLGVTAGTQTWFPTAPFNAVVCPDGERATPNNAEVVRVTARTGGTLTIVRAQEGSTARTIVVGDQIYAGATAKTLTDVELTGVPYRPVLPMSAPTSTATGAVNTYYGLVVPIYNTVTLTGIEYKVGTTGAQGNVRAALYAMTNDGFTIGSRVADRTSDLAHAAANTRQQVAFDSTYAALPGAYLALLWFSSAAATATMCNLIGSVSTTGTNATTTPTTPAALSSAANVDRVLMQVY